VAAGSEPARQHRRQPAAQSAAVASSANQLRFWLPPRRRRPPCLALAQAVPYEHQSSARGPTRCTATAAARRPYPGHRRSFLRPFLDVDR
jgi:hypothetical protein